MCGIAGVFSTTREASPLSAARNMADAIAHRGPDGAGAWADESVGIALAHQRLAVLDLSEAGAQPMVSACGRGIEFPLQMGRLGSMVRTVFANSAKAV